MAAVLGLAVAGYLAWAGGSHGAEIRLDPSVSYQTMTGWEASTDLPDTPQRPEWAAYEQALFETVADIGIDRLRLEVRSGAETRSDAPNRFLAGQFDYEAWRALRYDAANDNDDPFSIDPAGFNFAELDWHVEHFVLPLRAALKARGRPLVINLCYVSFRDGPFFQMDPEEYAEFVLATYQHLDRRWGFVPDLWEVVLEPDLPKNGWTGAQMGAAMAAASRRLRDAGYRPGFAAPSVTNLANALPYARDIAAVPGATEYWRELSYHRYRRASSSRVAAVAEYALAQGLKPAMLEWWFGRADTDVLYEDLTVGMNSSWQGRTLPGLVKGPDGKGGLRLQPEVRFNRLYFTAAPAGSVRIGAQSDAGRTLAPVAFRRPGGDIAVVVKASRRGTVTLRGLPPGTYRLTRVGDKAEDSAQVTVGGDGAAVVEMPFAGVFSLMVKS